MPRRWLSAGLILGFLFLAFAAGFLLLGRRGSDGNGIVGCSDDGTVVVTADLDGQDGLQIAGVGDLSRAIEYARIQDVEVAEDGKTALASISIDDSFRIARVNLENGGASFLTNPGKGNDYSPTQIGSNIFFWRSSRRSGDFFGGTNPAGLKVYVLQTDSSDIKKLTNRDFFDVGPIVVLNDGQTLVFRSFDTVHELDVMSGKLKDFMRLAIDITPIARSVERNRFLAIGSRHSSFDYDVYEVDAKSGEYTKISEGAGYVNDACIARETRDVFVMVGHREQKLERYKLKGGEPGLPE